MMIRKRDTMKRTISAVILLMVMMLQVGGKAFHLHHHVEREHVVCSDCEHHRVHGGHFLNWEDSSSDCILCQLFQTPYNKAQDVRINAVEAEHHTHRICRVVVVTITAQMYIISRAPPAFLL